MRDEELIEKVARVWIESGGDSIGFEFTHLKIRNKIRELEENDHK